MDDAARLCEVANLVVCWVRAVEALVANILNMMVGSGMAGSGSNCFVKKTKKDVLYVTMKERLFAYLITYLKL